MAAPVKDEDAVACGLDNRLLLRHPPLKCLILLTVAGRGDGIA